MNEMQAITKIKRAIRKGAASVWRGGGPVGHSAF